MDALEGVENPFSDILFLSDGLCGSSCDTASRTAYMLSQRMEHGTLEAPGSIPKIRFVTFGGLGGSASSAKRSLSATAYPGGNVMSAVMGLLYNPVFSAAALGYLAATWAGLQQMKAQIDVFRQRIPQYPFFWEQLPKYPQSEMYQNALGMDALPSEYYFFPTDLFLPEWFANVAGARPSSWNETELRRLHQAAAQGFQRTSPRLITALRGIDDTRDLKLAAVILTGAMAVFGLTWRSWRRRTSHGSVTLLSSSESEDP